MSSRTYMKTVVITGASSGFGKQCAKLFQKNGWNVVASMRSPEREMELCDLENVLVTRLDVTDFSSIKSAVKQGVETFGYIDALVNNAGYGSFGFLEEASTDEVRQQMDTNFFGVVNVTQAVLPQMRRQGGGVIVNVTGLNGLMGQPMWSLYSASKFAVEGLSESLNHELKAFGITVKTVAPGLFDTGFVSAGTLNTGSQKPDLDEYRETYRKFLPKLIEKSSQPFGMGNPKKVARVVYQCVINQKSRLKNTVGRNAKILIFLRGLLPNRKFFEILNKVTISEYLPDPLGESRAFYGNPQPKT